MHCLGEQALTGGAQADHGRFDQVGGGALTHRTERLAFCFSSLPGLPAVDVEQGSPPTTEGGHVAKLAAALEDFLLKLHLHTIRSCNLDPTSFPTSLET